ncbi:hypothetical protein V8E54_002730 [Elaphomyces granulatus]
MVRLPRYDEWHVGTLASGEDADRQVNLRDNSLIVVYWFHFRFQNKAVVLSKEFLIGDTWDRYEWQINA